MMQARAECRIKIPLILTALYAAFSVCCINYSIVLYLLIIPTPRRLTSCIPPSHPQSCLFDKKPSRQKYISITDSSPLVVLLVFSPTPAATLIMSVAQEAWKASA